MTQVLNFTDKDSANTAVQTFIKQGFRIEQRIDDQVVLLRESKNIPGGLMFLLRLIPIFGWFIGLAQGTNQERVEITLNRSGAMPSAPAAMAKPVPADPPQTRQTSIDDELAMLIDRYGELTGRRLYDSKHRP